MRNLNYLMTDVLLTISNTPLFKGTKSLVTDISTWLLVILPIITGVYCLFEAITMGAKDEQGQIGAKKKIKAIIIICVVGMSVSGLITTLATYYK